MRNVPFGGFDIFMFGDFRQLQPVGSTNPMYASIKNLGKAKKMSRAERDKLRQGRDAYKSFKHVISFIFWGRGPSQAAL